MQWGGPAWKGVSSSVGSMLSVRMRCSGVECGWYVMRCVGCGAVSRRTSFPLPAHTPQVPQYSAAHTQQSQYPHEGLQCCTKPAADLGSAKQSRKLGFDFYSGLL